MRSDSEESYDEAEHPNDNDEYDMGDVAGEESDIDDIEEGQGQSNEDLSAAIPHRLSTLQEAEDERNSVKLNMGSK